MAHQNKIKGDFDFRADGFVIVVPTEILSDGIAQTGDNHTKMSKMGWFVVVRVTQCNWK